MKIECSTEKLRNALSSTERITGKNLTLPILSSTLLVASGKSVKIRATNLSIGIEVEIPAKILSEGVLVFKGDIVFQALSGSKDELVTLENEGDLLKITTSQSVFSVKTYAHEDFPTIPLVEGEKVTISAKKLVDGIKSVSYSASISDIKPEISSIYMYLEEEFLVFVATDSFRLAEKRIKVKNIDAFSPLLIPLKNVVEIVRILETAEDDVSIVFSKNQVAFMFDRTYITSRVIDGVFPDYKQIIPKSKTTEAVILKQDMINTLKTVNIFSDKFNQINITISPKDKKCMVFAHNSDIGENISRLGAAMSGPEVELSFNYRYLIECFQSISSDSIVLECTEYNRPVIIKGVGDTTFKYLIMPMNR